MASDIGASFRQIDNDVLNDKELSTTKSNELKTRFIEIVKFHIEAKQLRNLNSEFNTEIAFNLLMNLIFRLFERFSDAYKTPISIILGIESVFVCGSLLEMDMVIKLISVLP